MQTKTRTSYHPSREQDDAAETLALTWDRVECDAITEPDGDMHVTCRIFGEDVHTQGRYSKGDTVAAFIIDVDGQRSVAPRVTL
jgi:hypothetical protein